MSLRLDTLGRIAMIYGEKRQEVKQRDDLMGEQRYVLHCLQWRGAGPRAESMPGRKELRP